MKKYEVIFGGIKNMCKNKICEKESFVQSIELVEGYEGLKNFMINKYNQNVIKKNEAHAFGNDISYFESLAVIKCLEDIKKIEFEYRCNELI